MEATVAIDIHKDLIESCKKGDQSAFGQLYNLYGKAMYNVALRIIKDRDEAEDVLQEAFVKAYKKINQFDYQATFGAWLKRIVINQSLDLLRKKRISFSDDIENQGERAEEEQVDWEEVDFTVEKIKHAITQLPAGFRMVCSMFLFEGYDHKEIAEVMGISEGTSKSQYHRAKLKIKEMLSSYEG